MTLNRLAGHARTHARTLVVIGTMQLYTLCLAVVLTAVANSTSTNMSYYYRQTSTSDFEQQLDQKHIIQVTCSWHAAGAMFTRVTLRPVAGDVSAPPSDPHLDADLFLRASAYFGVLQEFFISRIHLGHKVLELPVV